MVVKNPTSWVPQPLGYGYAIAQANLNLETKLLTNVETASLKPLQTAAFRFTGRNPTTWSNTGA